MKFTSHIKIESSVTSQISGIAAQKKAQGEKLYNFGAGEPQVEMPEVFLKTVQDGMKQGAQNYSPIPGQKVLRELAAQWMNENSKTNFSVPNVLITCGGKYAVYMLIQAFIQPGDEVLIPAPYWVSYPEMVRIFGGTPTFLQTRADQDFKISPEDLKKSCTSRTKILILNSASNPTGALYSREELREILTIAKEKNILVISDEVYSSLVYDGNEFTSCGSFPEFQENVVIVGSASKSFAMMGWRVGLIFGPADIIDLLSKIQSHSITNTSTMSQILATAAFQNAQAITPMICKKMKERRDLFAKHFQNIFGTALELPVSSLYFFIPLKSFGVAGTDCVGFCKKALEEANVVMVPGKAFGMEGFIRVCFGGADQDFEPGLKALKAII